MSVFMPRKKSEEILYQRCFQANSALSDLVYFEIGVSRGRRNPRSLYMHISFGEHEHLLPGGRIKFRIIEGQLSLGFQQCALIPHTASFPGQSTESLSIKIIRKGVEEKQSKTSSTIGGKLSATLNISSTLAGEVTRKNSRENQMEVTLPAHQLVLLPPPTSPRLYFTMPYLDLPPLNIAHRKIGDIRSQDRDITAAIVFEARPRDVCVVDASGPWRAFSTLIKSRFFKPFRQANKKLNFGELSLPPQPGMTSGEMRIAQVGDDILYQVVEELTSVVNRDQSVPLQKAAEILDLDLKQDLHGEDLSGLTFRGIDLHGADFSHCRIVGADFSGSDLSDATFRGSYLKDVRYEGSIIDRSDFRETTAENLTFDGASVREARFTSLEAYEKAGLREGLIRQVRFDDRDISEVADEQAKFAAGVREVSSAKTQAEGTERKVNTITEESSKVTREVSQEVEVESSRHKNSSSEKAGDGLKNAERGWKSER